MTEAVATTWRSGGCGMILFTAAIGALSVLGFLTLLGAIRESWEWGGLFRLRQSLRAWSAKRPPSRPLRGLRFRLGVYLLRPRLDHMYLVHNKKYEEAQNDFNLHHIFAIHTMRSWRSAVDETPDGRNIGSREDRP